VEWCDPLEVLSYHAAMNALLEKTNSGAKVADIAISGFEDERTKE